MRLDQIKAYFTRVSYEPIDLNSPKQVKEYLYTQGWEPTQWNKSKKTREITSPKLTEDSYASIRSGVGKQVAERNILVHRRNFLQNYNKPETMGLLSFIREDGRVPAEGNLCAAVTSRTKHKGAVCNVPGGDSILGKEMRSLYYTLPPYCMLGADLDQIEARITAHYAAKYDGGDYWSVLQSVKDIHEYNGKLIGSDRKTAKAFQYAIFFGARAPKLATIIGCSTKVAGKHIKNFWSGNQGVEELVERLKLYYKLNGYIKGLDGRKIFIRAEYKLLNSLIQTAAAIVFKKWSNIADRNLRAAGLDCSAIIRLHDEVNYRCLLEDSEEASCVIRAAAVEAGEYYDLYTPITVDVKQGQSWWEVH